MELVSAVIITHNRKDLVMRAIESVLTQTYTNIECIVVDDASKRYPAPNKKYKNFK